MLTGICSAPQTCMGWDKKVAQSMEWLERTASYFVDQILICGQLQKKADLKTLRDGYFS